ncbi:hypothetical protein ACFODZ_07820 [Marinicella sediminis]|uniref:Uncharacterized protein n=1 Tax=Marinicella sediminis TaxID=1792834 RepID=A0ABV7J7S8_9GAMM|nr:hypothetical protein [Marinicella sediminis]
MNTQHFLTSFLKAAGLTAVMIGSLVAQSYATNALFSDTVMKMNIEFSATDNDQTQTQVAAMTVRNEQESSLEFGDHQINIKTTFINWSDEATEPEQIFAELILNKIAENGEVEFTHTPKFMIDKNKWAEFKIAPTADQEGIEFKMKYEDFHRLKDEKAHLDQPVWLDWGMAQNEAEVC